MAAMTQDAGSRSLETLPRNIYPKLYNCTPQPVLGSAGPTLVRVKGSNIAFGSSLQMDGGDITGSTWVSPTRCHFTSALTPGYHEITVTSPEGLKSNAVAFVVV